MTVFDASQGRAGYAPLDATTYRWTLRASDVAAGAFALVLAIVLVPPTPGLFENAFAWHNFLGSGFALGALPALGLFLVMMEDLRASALVAHPYDHARRLLSATATGLLFHGCLAFLAGGQGGGAPTLIALWVLVPLLISVFNHALNAAYARWSDARQPLVLLGEEETLTRALTHLTRNPAAPLDILDALAITDEDIGPRDGRLLATLKLCVPHYPRETMFLLGRDRLSQEELADLRDFITDEGIKATLVIPDAARDAADRRATPGVTFRAFAPRGIGGDTIRRAAKRTLDIILAGSALALLSPFFLVIGLLIRADGGPAFFAHGRVGQNGRLFRCLKFRTMVQNADVKLANFLADNPEAADEWRQTQKLRNDPRITPVGAFLRKTSLDELPQLINVLRGEMSLVGPRPIVTDERPRYGRSLPYYLGVRPGITGLWQVSGRSSTTYRERVEFDVWYAQNWSLWLDLWIMVRTVPEVLARRGAC